LQPGLVSAPKNREPLALAQASAFTVSTATILIFARAPGGIALAASPFEKCDPYNPQASLVRSFEDESHRTCRRERGRMRRPPGGGLALLTMYLRAPRAQTRDDKELRDPGKKGPVRSEEGVSESRARMGVLGALFLPARSTYFPCSRRGKDEKEDAGELAPSRWGHVGASQRHGEIRGREPFPREEN
jgi:hypothetical protein